MEPFSMVVGIVVLVLTIGLAIRWRWTASRLYWWYNMLSEEDGRPWWRRGHFQPTETQSIIVAWLFIAAGCAASIVILLEGLGLVNYG
jgi:hypothetical protein